jgi:glutathione peroxidase
MFVSIRILLDSVFSWINHMLGNRKKPVGGSFYDYKVPSLKGEIIDFAKYKGKKLLIVNTASKCGFTGQLHEMQKLHEQYYNKLEVLGFPANDFLWQEPGTNEDIAVFCQLNYGVTFQMFEKISVKGKNMHPVYRWLEAKSGKAPSWNFCKYLVDENGDVIDFFLPKVKPLDPQIINKI